MVPVSPTFSVSNEASASSTNNIPAVTGTSQNFAFQLQFSDVNMTISGDTLGLDPVNVTVTLTDLQQALAVGATFTSSGSSTVTIPTSDCDAVKFLCLTVSSGAGASYIDVDTGNNVMCVDVVTRKGCDPGKNK